MRNAVRGSCHVFKAVYPNKYISVPYPPVAVCLLPTLLIKIDTTFSHLVYSYGSCVAIKSKHNACHTRKVWVFGTIPDDFLLCQVSVVKQYRNLSQGVSCSSTQIYL